MHYEINVALNGSHFFATADRSFQSEHSLKAAIKLFKKKFPVSEGYSILVTKWESKGQGIDISKF